MRQEIMDLILQAEYDYEEELNASVANAENYVDECKKKQDVFLERLKYEWYLFEKAEREKLEKAVAETELRMEAETRDKMARLKTLQGESIERVSERLKEEVLAFIWR